VIERYVFKPEVSYQVGREKKVTSYCIGSPMGIYSSWASFALCHHLLARTAARLAGVKSRGNYLILGDDIVIKGKKFSTSYIRLIKALDIGLSKPDSFESNDSNSIVEFASRRFRNGIELSPLPMRLLKDETSPRGTNLLDEISFLVEAIDRGHNLCLKTTDYPGTYSELQATLLVTYLTLRLKGGLEDRYGCLSELTFITDIRLHEILVKLVDQEVGSAAEFL